jgi:hypothetical protein
MFGSTTSAAADSHGKKAPRPPKRKDDYWVKTAREQKMRQEIRDADFQRLSQIHNPAPPEDKPEDPREDPPAVLTEPSGAYWRKCLFIYLPA